MPRTPDEPIGAALLDIERRLGAGVRLRDAVRAHGISPSTYYRWRRRLEALPPAGIVRAATLEQENGRLRRVVADQALTIEALREISRGTY